jgi:hypothetical protein
VAIGEAVEESGLRRIGCVAGQTVAGMEMRPVRLRPFVFLELETDGAGDGFRGAVRSA